MTAEDITRLRAKVSRLLPSELHVLDALIASALRRPTGGHTIAAVELRSQSTRVDPRAEPEVGSAMPKTGDLEGPPTRRERRISEQVERVTRKPASGHFKAATRLLTEADAERVIGAEGPWKGPKP